MTKLFFSRLFLPALLLSVTKFQQTAVEAKLPMPPILKELGDLGLEQVNLIPESFQTSDPNTILEPRDSMIQGEVFNGTTGFAIAALSVGLSYLPGNLLFDDDECESQTFGFSGEYNDTVCNTYNAIKDVCIQDETCDPALMHKVVAAKGDILNHPDELAMVSCLSSGLVSPAALCSSKDFRDAATITDQVNGLIWLIDTFVPNGGRNNPLITNDWGLPFSGNDPAGSPSNPNGFKSRYTYGDGALEFMMTALTNRNANRSEQHMKVFLNLDMLRTMVTQYCPQTTYEEYTFCAITMEGYFMEEYKEALYTKADRSTMIDGAYQLHDLPCATPMGVLASSWCGYNATDMVAFIEHYYSLLTIPDSSVPGARDDGPAMLNVFCSRFGVFQKRKAKVVMSCDANNSHNICQNNPVHAGVTKLTHGQCIAKLRLA